MFEIIKIIIIIIIIRELETTAFCMFLSTELHRPLPTKWCKLSVTLRELPPSTSILILCCSVLYPWYLLLSSYHSGAYLLVFSALLISLLLSHGQLILSSNTFFFFFFLSITAQSILLSHLHVFCIQCYVSECLSFLVLVEWLRHILRMPQWYRCH